MAGLMDLLNSLRGGLPGQQTQTPQNAGIAQMMAPQAKPVMDPNTQMTGFAPPVQVAPPKGLRGMFGLDDQVGKSGLSRGDMGALALSQFGSTYGRNANGGNGGNQLIQTMVASKAKEKQAESKRQQLAAQMKAAGYSEQDIVAVQFAPEQAIKAIYDRAAPYTLNQGDARFGPGGKLEANNPKFAYQNDTILQEGPGGVQNMGRLEQSYSDLETGRHNRQMEGIGWKNARTSATNAGSQWRAMTPEEVAQKGLTPGTAAQINTVTGKYEVAPQGSKSSQLTEQEAKFGLYAGQALQAASDLDAMEASGYNRSSWGEMATSAFSDEAKLYDNKVDQFKDAWMRAMTGAGMTNQEADRYIQQLSPKPFDTQAVREQKSEMRSQMAQQLRIAAGRGMKIADQTQIDRGSPQAGGGQQPQVPLVDLNGRIIR